MRNNQFLTSLNGIDLSFSSVREYERTKHVHRLHPYLGKFIPQLVEVFLKHYFKKNNWVLDPFMGSGTTIVVAEKLGRNCIGIEINPEYYNYVVQKFQQNQILLNF